MFIQFKKEILSCFSNKIIKMNLWLMAAMLGILFILFESKCLAFNLFYKSFWEGYYYFFSFSLLSSVYFSSTIGYQLVKHEARVIKFILYKKELIRKLLTTKILFLAFVFLFFQLSLLGLFLLNHKYSSYYFTLKFTMTELLILFTTNILFLNISTIMIFLLKDFNSLCKISYKNLITFIVIIFHGLGIILFHTYYLSQYYELMMNHVDKIAFNVGNLTIGIEIFLLLVIFNFLFSLNLKHFFKSF